MAIRSSNDAGNGSNSRPAILVYFFKGWPFEMAESSYGDSIGKHRSFVFSRVF